MSEEARQEKRPNVIWIFGDQHRAQATGYNGDPNLFTPHLDRMAMEGVNFGSAVCGFPLCCPFRGSLLTSQYPHNCVPGHEFQMPPDQKTIAHVFNDEGYHTAYFGKWHLDGFKERNGRAGKHIIPPERRGGFQKWIGYENNNSQYDCWVHGGEGDDAFQYRLPGFETDCLTDLLIDYVKGRASTKSDDNTQPFFAVLSVQPPHDPYVAPPEFMQTHTPGRIQFRPNVPDIKRVRDQARLELNGYYAQIENLDWNIGRIRETLEELGLTNDTHIIFFSDHGDMHGSHGQFRKTTPYEESLRIPFIIAGGRPQYRYYRGRNDVPLNHVDIAPTTLGLCGIDKPEWMMGTDYSFMRDGDRPKPDFPDSAYIQETIPTGHGNSVDRPWRGVVTRDGWKYVCMEGQPWLMFNLNEDPYEEANLAHNTAFRAERKRLHEKLQWWIQETGDDFHLPKI